MGNEQVKEPPESGGSPLNGGLDEMPIIKFRANELINYIWHVYHITRISEAIREMPELENEADPMIDENALRKLILGWVDELKELPLRDDGTVIFEQEPVLIDIDAISSNAN